MAAMIQSTEMTSHKNGEVTNMRGLRGMRRRVEDEVRGLSLGFNGRNPSCRAWNPGLNTVMAVYKDWWIIKTERSNIWFARNIQAQLNQLDVPRV